ncbi:SpaA isopeptide-forming pilin-related protein [Enterococcus larvae]|uniref:SpaA isopeptide-forming pilin-related protein n=1 Tax=Enterococcus larvae TaxID=2794352 RepID=UPI003F3FBAF9
MKIRKKAISLFSTLLMTTQFMIAPVQVLAEEGALEATQSSADMIQTEESSSTQIQESTSTSESIQLPTDLFDPLPLIQAEVETPTTSAAGQNYWGYTNDGSIISYSNGPSLSREIGNSVGQIQREYAGGHWVYDPVKYIDGLPAWCINPTKGFPMGASYTRHVYTGDKANGVYNILYYAMQNGWTDGYEYVDVYVALNSYLGNTHPQIDFSASWFTTEPTVAFLLDKANVQDAPQQSFDIQNKHQVADFNTATKEQETGWYTPIASGGDIYYTFTIPAGITGETSTGQSLSAGTHTLKHDVSFKLKAPANYTGVIEADVTTTLKRYAAAIYTPDHDSSLQDLIALPGGDEIEESFSTRISAEFFARTGDFQIYKKSDVTGLPIPGVEFKVELSTGETVNFTTDSSGIAKYEGELIHGVTGKVTEVKAPSGYAAATGTFDFTIEAGQTVEIVITNEIQEFRLKGKKIKEYLDEWETMKQGQPVYVEQAVEGIVFEQKVASETITLPDMTTIVGKFGDSIDKMTTDQDGNFASNVTFYGGIQNEYQLFEHNVPENYRSPDEVQTSFAIPYGSNTEKLITYDIGTIENKLKKGEWTFNKRDKFTFVNLAGAEFYIEGVSKHNQNVHFQFTTETVATVFTLPEGTYKVTEVKFPDGYIQTEGETETRFITIQDGQTTTTDWSNTLIPVKMSTQAYANNGGKAFDPTVDNVFYDEISISENFAEGKTLVTTLIGEETGTVYDEFEGELIIDGTGKVLVETVIPANTIQNENVYFYEAAYNDEEKTDLYCEHDGKGDYGQTLFYKTEEPKMGTQAYVNDNSKEFDPTVDNVFYDEISISENFAEGKTLVTKLVGEKTGTVYDEFEGELIIDGTGKVLVKTVIPANTIQNENVYFDEAAYNDEEKTDIYCKHDGKGDYGQTVFYKEKEKTTANVSLPSSGSSSAASYSLPNTGEKAELSFSFAAILVLFAAGVIVIWKRKNDEA